MTFKQFAEKHNVSFDSFLSYTDVDGRNFYSVRINGQSFDYNQGSAIKHEPRVEDVLCCLAMDVRSLESASNFEDWANDFGYDTDSRKAYATYEAIKAENVKLMHAFGENQTIVDELLNCEEE